ncbi:hypothetical protein [Mycobacterium sp.]|uniref:hypothetical protein n=1 Tax=Mycobacterium sp. TaxID=1785 RepID=UPI003BA8505E
MGTETQRRATQRQCRSMCKPDDVDTMPTVLKRKKETAASADLPDGPFRCVPFLGRDLYAAYAGQHISHRNIGFTCSAVSIRTVRVAE